MRLDDPIDAKVNPAVVPEETHVRHDLANDPNASLPIWP